MHQICSADLNKTTSQEACKQARLHEGLCLSSRSRLIVRWTFENDLALLALR